MRFQLSSVGIASVAVCTSFAAALPPSWQTPQTIAMGSTLTDPLLGIPFGASVALDMRPRINDAGDMAFAYGNNSTGIVTNGVWVNGVNVLTQFAPNLSPNHTTGAIGLSGNGRVVWYGSVSTGPGGLYSYNIPTGVPAFHGGAPGNSTKLYPSVNNAGIVAMFEGIPARMDLATNAGATVPNLGSIVPGSRRVLDQNNAGQIAFLDNRLGKGIVRIEPDNSVTVLSPYSPATRLFESLTINTSGAAAFFRSTTSFTPTELIVANGVTTQTIATAGSGQAFSSFASSTQDPGYAPVINDSGWVAFLGKQQGGTLGVYVSDGSTTTRVFGEGDGVSTPLGTLTAVFGTKTGMDMNGRGDLLIHVGLQYPSGGVGESFVLIRAVPAPGIGGVLAASLIAIGGRRRR